MQARSLIYSFCIIHGMIVAAGGIGYGGDPGDVLKGVGTIGPSATAEARQVGIRVMNLAERLTKSKK